MKKNLIFIVTILIIGIVILSYALFFNSKKTSNSLGGERDEHGCLIPAGYSWNETEQECVREWETSEEKYQVNNFESCLDAGYPVLESLPRQCRTPSGRTFTE